MVLIGKVEEGVFGRTFAAAAYCRSYVIITFYAPFQIVKYDYTAASGVRNASLIGPNTISVSMGKLFMAAAGAEP